MKAIYKTLLLAALFLLCHHSVTAQQQSDTIQGLDVRYYRNCYWLDTTRSIAIDEECQFNGLYTVSAAVQRIIFRFIPDRPLNIIGIAGAMTFVHMTLPWDPQYRMPEWMRDSLVTHRRPEWFELYGTRVYDSVGNVLHDVDSLTLLGSVAWSLQDSSRFISLSNIFSYYSPTSTVPIIERYFPKPIWQDTDFYIGYTNFNHGYIYDPQPIGDNTILQMYYHVGTSTYHYLTDDIFAPRDSCNSYSINLTGSRNSVLFQLPTSETNTYEPWTDSVSYIRGQSLSLPLIFPIVDTTGMWGNFDEPDSCYAVEGFRLLDQQGNMAAFAWTDDSSPDVWQLSWGEEGIAPEEGTIVYAPTNVKSIVGLQDSVVYTAFVRARCNDTLFSEWSEPLRFWKGMNDTVSLQPTNTVEQLTYIYPNPAENSVTVACSFAMSLVELFALDGTKLISQPANGIMTQIDLTPFPKGTYMLRITTPAGTAIKKLIRR